MLAEAVEALETTMLASLDPIGTVGSGTTAQHIRRAIDEWRRVHICELDVLDQTFARRADVDERIERNRREMAVTSVNDLIAAIKIHRRLERTLRTLHLDQDHRPNRPARHHRSKIFNRAAQARHRARESDSV